MNAHYDDFDAIRAAGYALVEEAVHHLEGPFDGPVTTLRRPAELAAAFAAAPPAAGRPLDAVLARVRADIARESMRHAHPMYMGHQVCPPLPVAALADALVSMLNQSQAVWDMSPAGTLLEARLIDWFADLAGFGAGAGGSFVSGGSAGNLTALLAARATRFPDAWRRGNPPGLALLTGQQAHYSIARAAGILGLGADAVVAVPTTPAGATDPRAVAEALDALAAEGRPVLAVAATAGSTPTGAYDDLPALADICQTHGVWLHVDGAHGASALISTRERHRMRGVERADSLAWDPHKMMFQPLSSAVVLVRDRRTLQRAFQQDAPYLFHGQEDADAPVDPGAWTLQCSRRADALRLWIALEYYGTDALAALLEHTVDLARALHERLETAPDFEALHAPESNIVCFRYRPAGVPESELDALQDRVRARYIAEGRGWIAATTLDGRRVLRVTLINPRTEARHLDAMIAGVREVGVA
ncbi:MAG TPA: pyridoxal-dependent decarboxylase [Longimicrobiales bacterium]